MDLSPLQKIALKLINTDSQYYLIMWWCKKYNLPSNHPLLLDLTWEELYLQYMIDIYSLNPDRRRTDEALLGIGVPVWDGRFSSSEEEQVQQKLKALKAVDLSKWVGESTKVSDEFDETFTEGDHL